MEGHLSRGGTDLRPRHAHPAGAGLCRKEVVENIIRQGPERIQDLIKWGVKFDPRWPGDQRESDLT